MKHQSGTRKRILSLLLCSFIALFGLTGCTEEELYNFGVLLDQINAIFTQGQVAREIGVQCENDQYLFSDGSVISVPEDLPEFEGEPYAVLNGNEPFFTEEMTASNVSRETYGFKDDLQRCTAVASCVGTDLMPEGKRGSIGMVKPSGWHTVKYDFINGKYLYNRCHLIGFQLTGEGANDRNLITGTRYLNIEGMLPFENEVADFVRSTDEHVMYRVTPVFVGSELVARGVIIEAESIEDGGQGICFNVYCFNVQPGVAIDYATGDNKAVKKAKSGSTDKKAA